LYNQNHFATPETFPLLPLAKSGKFFRYNQIENHIGFNKLKLKRCLLRFPKSIFGKLCSAPGPGLKRINAHFDAVVFNQKFQKYKIARGCIRDNTNPNPKNDAAQQRCTLVQQVSLESWTMVVKRRRDPDREICQFVEPFVLCTTHPVG
jgi:hypothetical protein